METTIMGYIGIILGLYWGYIGIMEKRMETTIVYWGYDITWVPIVLPIKGRGDAWEKHHVSVDGQILYKTVNPKLYNFNPKSQNGHNSKVMQDSFHEQLDLGPWVLGCTGHG